MSITVTRLDDTESNRWDDHVATSPDTTPFHQWAGLEAVADYSGWTLHPLVGYNGDQPVALLPLFERSTGRQTLVRSPPGLLESFPLGPAFLNLGGTKQRKAERRRTEFVDAAEAWLDDHLDPSYVHLRPGPAVSDVRPFHWNGYESTPHYTYVVDLTPDPEDLLGSFSRDARTNVRDAEDAGATVREGGSTEVAEVIRQVERRHREQGEPYPMSVPFVAACHDRLPDGQVRPYVVERDGERVTGMVTLEYGDTVYRWQGGVKYGGDIPATDLLDWRIMQAARERGVERYDLVGANLRRLCGYKAKFSPEPVVYYNLKRQARLHRMATDVASLVDDVVGGVRELRARVD
jgi:hypothetical protein